MLQIRNLNKTFANKKVLTDINFDVIEKEVVTVIGPSGSGKTTLLRCINFLERADQGILIFDNQHIDLHSATKAEQYSIRQKTAFVFQNYNLFSNKTVLQNVTEGLIIGRKIPKKQAIDIAIACLDKVGLNDKYHNYPCQLSGGQQQRVGIARAIAVNPKAILLDEPTSALDPELTVEILSILQKLKQEGTTMLIVTHEMSFAEKVANKVIFMEQGYIVEQGQPEQIFNNPQHTRTKQFLNKMSV